jgi:GNAT superfamily N-acetyltransferase
MTEESGISVQRWSGRQALADAGELKRIYADAYAEPPYHKGPAEAERLLLRLTDQVDRPGFAFLVSCVDTLPVGFAFGRRFTEGQWWHGAEILPPARYIEAEKYAVSELVVASAYRGRRLSSRLMAELLRERPEPYATLLSRPGSLARTIYHHWGWRAVGTARALPQWPATDALVLDLRIPP